MIRNDSFALNTVPDDDSDVKSRYSVIALTLCEDTHSGYFKSNSTDINNAIFQRQDVIFYAVFHAGRELFGLLRPRGTAYLDPGYKLSLTKRQYTRRYTHSSPKCPSALSY